MHESPLGEEGPDAAVVHASVVIATLVPRIHHFIGMMVYQPLIGLVVGANDFLLIRHHEEVVGQIDHRIEVVISVTAGGHR